MTQSFREMAGAMQQYWYFKKDNYDKIICFKLGKFYEIFETKYLLYSGYLSRIIDIGANFSQEIFKKINSW